MKLQINNNKLSSLAKKVLLASEKAIDKMLIEKTRKNEKIAISENGKVKVIEAKKILKERGIQIDKD